MQQLILTFGCWVLLTGCHVALHPYKDYLNQSIGHAKQDAIAEKMGAPNRTVALNTGGQVWAYEYCAAAGGVTAPKGSVPESHIILVFDKSGRLVRWHDQDLTASS